MPDLKLPGTNLNYETGSGSQLIFPPRLKLADQRLVGERGLCKFPFVCKFSHFCSNSSHCAKTGRDSASSRSASTRRARIRTQRGYQHPVLLTALGQSVGTNTRPRVAYRQEVSPLRIGSINAQVFGNFVHLLGQVFLTLGQGLQALEDDMQRKIESIIER